MKWTDIKGAIGKAAPLLGTAIAGPGGAAIGGLIAQALGVGDTPDEVAQALQADPEAMLKLKALEREHERELRRMVLEAETRQHAEINATMRAEAVSQDAYVRRWRPTFGYAVAATWIIQTIGLFVAVAYAISTPEQAGMVIRAVGDLMGALTVMWSLALAVLGINVTSRSRDKQVAAGQTPPAGLLSALARRITPIP